MSTHFAFCQQTKQIKNHFIYSLFLSAIYLNTSLVLSSFYIREGLKKVENSTLGPGPPLEGEENKVIFF